MIQFGLFVRVLFVFTIQSDGESSSDPRARCQASHEWYTARSHVLLFRCYAFARSWLELYDGRVTFVKSDAENESPTVRFLVASSTNIELDIRPLKILLSLFLPE